MRAQVRGVGTLKQFVKSYPVDLLLLFRGFILCVLYIFRPFIVLQQPHLTKNSDQHDVKVETLSWRNVLKL